MIGQAEPRFIQVFLKTMNFQAKIPQLSDKELAMSREVSSLDRKVQALEGGVKQLREKER